MLNYTTSILCLVLSFAVIHLGVSISIIDQNRDYGGIFRPETGLASYNIVISVLGILVGVLGLFFKPTSRQQYSRYFLCSRRQ
jgi:uncharacterized membrane protein